MAHSGNKKQRFKTQRRLGIELPGLGRPGALAKRNFPPGQHGSRSRRSKSQFASRLAEKQKLRFHYGMREGQLRLFVRRSKKGASLNWVEAFFTRLESRLDNVVFRLGFAASIAAARQLITHRKILVNNKPLTIPSYITALGDTINLLPAYYSNPAVSQSLQAPRLPLPEYLSLSEGDIKTGTVIATPTYADIPFVLERRFIAEYYNKTK